MAKIGVHEIEGLVRVGETTDAKGNPVVALEILGIPVAYAPESALDRFAAEDWEEILTERLADVLRGLVFRDNDPQVWSKESPTGREVRRLTTLEV